MAGKFYSDDFAANEPLPRGDKEDKGIGVFGVVMLVLLVFSVFRILSSAGGAGGTTNFYVDLGGLLQNFADAPTIPMDWISLVTTNFGDTFPYGFQWLGGAIDFFVSIFAGSAFVSVAAANALVFVFYFVRWLLL